MSSIIVEKINDFCNIYGKLLIKLFQKQEDNISPESESVLSEEEEKEINKLLREIFYYMLWNPGALLEFENKNDMEYAKLILNLIWDKIIIDPDIHYDYLNSEQFYLDEHDTFDVLFQSALRRLKLLKPTFLINIQQDYNPNFKAYYKEAMLAWLYGLNNAAIVLCCAILEEALEDIMITKSLDYKREDFKTLIDHAEFLKVIDENIAKKFHEIRRIRNKSIHDLEGFTDKTTLEQIINTKELIEKIYSDI